MTSRRRTFKTVDSDNESDGEPVEPLDTDRPSTAASPSYLATCDLRLIRPAVT